MQRIGDDFGLSTEEAEINGSNLMPLLWEETNSSTNTPQTIPNNGIGFGYPSPEGDGDSQYFFERLGDPVSPLFVNLSQPTSSTTPSHGLRDSFFAQMDGRYVRSPQGTLANQGLQEWYHFDAPPPNDPITGRPRLMTPPPVTPAQAKNRKAQKKFREKQKAKMVSLSEEVENLRRRVQNLSIEKQDLENSNMLLGKVVTMRDKQMNTLKSHNECLKHCHDHQTEDEKGLPLLNDSKSLSPEKIHVLQEQLAKKCSASKVSNLSMSEMRQIWKKFIEKFSHLLLEHDTNPKNQMVLKEITETVANLSEICMQYATLCPSDMCLLVANVELAPRLHSDSFEAQAFWKSVLQSLKLTEEQEKLTLDLRRIFLQHLDLTWKERAQFSSQLQMVVQQKNTVYSSNSTSCELGRSAAEIIHGLSETCYSDGHHHTDFISQFFQTVLEDVQTARAFVQSYPYYPDVLLLSNFIAQKHQENYENPSSSGTDSHAPASFSLLTGPS